MKEDVSLELNTLGDNVSRAVYREKLVEYFGDHYNQLSKESIIRFKKNPLRILDSKAKEDRELILEAPLFEYSLNERSQEFFSKVKEGLKILKIPFNVNPHLVRGMDYYCHTAFEFTTTSLGSQGAILAGGRYDGLAEAMGEDPVPGIGWAAGVERLGML